MYAGRGAWIPTRKESIESTPWRFCKTFNDNFLRISGKIKINVKKNNVNLKKNVKNCNENFNGNPREMWGNSNVKKNLAVNVTNFYLAKIMVIIGIIWDV